MLKTKEYKFEPGARAIVQMGEELIGHPSTALGELVKNAYDADAKECKVYVHIDKDSNKSFLFVFDNGLGMSEKVLFGEWLQPSVSSKRIGQGKSGLFKRNLLGSKGIGRLAAMALGRKLTVVSKTNDENDFNWLSIDREQFKEEVLLSQITFPGGSAKDFIDIFDNDDLLRDRKATKNDLLVGLLQSEFQKNISHGSTLIVVEQLDDSIAAIINENLEDADTLLQESGLMMSFRSLITPLFISRDVQQDLLKKKIISDKFLEQNKDDVFSLFFGSNLYLDGKKKGEDIFYPIEPLPILQHFGYRVLGVVNSDGTVKGHYSCQRLGNDKQEKEFDLNKEFVFSDETLRKRREIGKEDVAEDDKSKVGRFYFDIRVYDRDPDSIDKIIDILKKTRLDIGRAPAKRLMDKILRFRISKNGFGVKPYGEEAIDWMELGQMRVQSPAQTIGPNQILGYVFLFSPENDGLNEKTNREGFFENRAFSDLKKIIRAILIEFGRRRYIYRLKHNLGRTIKSKLALPDTKAYLDFINNRTSDKKIIQKSESFVKDITTTLDNMEYTLTFSERLASLGSGLELVYHELAQPITQLGGTRYSLDLKKDKIEMQAVREKFIEDIRNLSAGISALDTLKISLQPAIGIARPKTFNPLNTFMKVCVLFKKDISDEKIEVKTDDSLKDYEIKDYEYALWISFLNIMNNAVYWLKRGEGEKKIIQISLENKNTIVLSNNGPLIPKDYLEAIFEYGVTLKQEKNATGLGLSFTRNILGAHGWEIWAENRRTGPAFLLRKVKKNE